MKPLHHSRTFWIALGATVVQTMTASLAAADGAPKWLVVAASTLGAGANAVILFLRAADVGKGRGDA